MSTRIQNALENSWWTETGNNLSTGFGLWGNQKDHFYDKQDDLYSGEFSANEGSYSDGEKDIVNAYFREIGYNATNMVKSNIKIKKVKRSEMPDGGLVYVSNKDGVQNDEAYLNATKKLAKSLKDSGISKSDYGYIVSIENGGLLDDEKFSKKLLGRQSYEAIKTGKLSDGRTIDEKTKNNFTNEDGTYDLHKFLEMSTEREMKKAEIMVSRPDIQTLGDSVIDEALDLYYFKGKGDSVSDKAWKTVKGVTPLYDYNDKQLGGGLFGDFLRLVKVTDRDEDIVSDARTDAVNKLAEAFATEHWERNTLSGMVISTGTQFAAEVGGHALAGAAVGSVASPAGTAAGAVAGGATGILKAAGSALSKKAAREIIAGKIKNEVAKNVIGKGINATSTLLKATPGAIARGVWYGDDAMVTLNTTLDDMEKGKGNYVQLAGAVGQLGLSALNFNLMGNIGRNRAISDTLRKGGIDYSGNYVHKVTTDSVGDALLSNLFDSAFTVMQGRDIEWGQLLVSGAVEGLMIGKNYRDGTKLNNQNAAFDNDSKKWLNDTIVEYNNQTNTNNRYTKEEFDYILDEKRNRTDFDLLKNKEKLESLLAKKNELVMYINDKDNRPPAEVKKKQKELAKLENTLAETLLPFRNRNEAEYNEYLGRLEENHRKVIEQKAKKEEELQQKIQEKLDAMETTIDKEAERLRSLSDREREIMSREVESFRDFAMRRMKEGELTLGGEKIEKDSDKWKHLEEVIIHTDMYKDAEVSKMTTEMKERHEAVGKALAEMQYDSLIPFYGEWKDLDVDRKRMLSSIKSYALLSIAHNDALMTEIRLNRDYEKIAAEVNAELAKKGLKIEIEEVKKFTKEAIELGKKQTKEIITNLQNLKKDILGKDETYLDGKEFLTEAQSEKIKKFMQTIQNTDAVIASKADMQKTLEKKYFLEKTEEVHKFISDTFKGIRFFTQDIANQKLAELIEYKKQLQKLELENPEGKKLFDTKSLNKSIMDLEKFLKNVDAYRNKILLDYGLKAQKLDEQVDFLKKENEELKQKNEELEKKLESAKTEDEQNEILSNFADSEAKVAERDLAKASVIIRQASEKAEKNKTTESTTEKGDDTPTKRPKKQKRTLTVGEILNSPHLITSDKLKSDAEKVVKESKEIKKKEKEAKEKEIEEKTGKTIQINDGESSSTKESASNGSKSQNNKKKEIEPKISDDVKEVVKTTRKEIKLLQKNLQRAKDLGYDIPEVIVNMEFIKMLSYENIKLLNNLLENAHQRKLTEKSLRNAIKNQEKTDKNNHKIKVQQAKQDKKEATKGKKAFVNSIIEKQRKLYDKQIKSTRDARDKAKKALNKEFDIYRTKTGKQIENVDKELTLKKKEIDKEAKKAEEQLISKQVQQFIHKYPQLSKKSILSNIKDGAKIDTAIIKEMMDKYGDIKQVALDGHYQKIIDSIYRKSSRIEENGLIITDKTDGVLGDGSDGLTPSLEHEVSAKNLKQTLNDWLLIKTKERNLLLSKGHFGQADRIQEQMEYRVKMIEELVDDYILSADSMKKFFEHKYHIDASNLQFGKLFKLGVANAMPPDEIIAIIDNPEGTLTKQFHEQLYPGIKQKEFIMLQFSEIFDGFEKIEKQNGLEPMYFITLFEAKNEYNRYLQGEDGNPGAFLNSLFISNGRIVQMEHKKAKELGLEPFTEKHQDILDTQFSNAMELVAKNTGFLSGGGTIKADRLVSEYKRLTSDINKQNAMNAYMLGKTPPPPVEWYVPHKRRQRLVNENGEVIASGKDNKVDDVFSFEDRYISPLNKTYKDTFGRKKVVGKEWTYTSYDDLYKDFNEAVTSVYVENPAKMMVKLIHDQIPAGDEHQYKRDVLKTLVKSFAPEVLEGNFFDRAISFVTTLQTGLALGLNPFQYITQKGTLMTDILYNGSSFNDLASKTASKYRFQLDKYIPELAATSQSMNHSRLVNSNEYKINGNEKWKINPAKWNDIMSRFLMRVGGMFKGDREMREMQAIKGTIMFMDDYAKQNNLRIKFDPENVFDVLKTGKITLENGDVIFLNKKDYGNMITASDKKVSGVTMSNIKQNTPVMFNTQGFGRFIKMLQGTPFYEMMIGLTNIAKAEKGMQTAWAIFKFALYLGVVQQISSEISAARAMADEEILNYLKKNSDFLQKELGNFDNYYSYYDKNSLFRNIFNNVNQGTYTHGETIAMVLTATMRNTPLVYDFTVDGFDGVLSRFLNKGGVIDSAVKIPGIQGILKNYSANKSQYNEEGIGEAIHGSQEAWTRDKEQDVVESMNEGNYSYVINDAENWLSKGDISMLHTAMDYKLRMQTGEKLSKDIYTRQKDAATAIIKELAISGQLQYSNQEMQTELERIFSELSDSQQESIQKAMDGVPSTSEDWLIKLKLRNKPDEYVKKELKKHYENNVFDRDTYEKILKSLKDRTIKMQQNVEKFETRDFKTYVQGI